MMKVPKPLKNVIMHISRKKAERFVAIIPFVIEMPINLSDIYWRGQHMRGGRVKSDHAYLLDSDKSYNFLFSIFKLASIYAHLQNVCIF